MLNKKRAEAILHEAGINPDKIIKVERATTNRSSHEVYFLDFLNERRRKRIVFKGVPERRERTPKNYCLEKEARVLQSINKCNGDSRYSVPEMLFMDTSRKIYPEDYFLMEPVIGETISDLFKRASTRDERLELTREVATICSWVHSLDLASFDFIPTIDYGEVFLDRFRHIIGQIEPYFTKYKPQREWDLTRHVQKRLNLEKPDMCDFALINGDISTGHFVKKNGGWCILDWDPSTIGDKSWDLYWALKGIPEWVLGLKDGVERLTEFYEEESGKQLINSSYYQIAGIAMA